VTRDVKGINAADSAIGRPFLMIERIEGMKTDVEATASRWSRSESLILPATSPAIGVPAC